MTEVAIYAGICGFTTTEQSEDQGGGHCEIKHRQSMKLVKSKIEKPAA